MDHIIFSEDQIRARVAELGDAITLYYQEKKDIHTNNPLIIAPVLKGALIFCSDLIRKINVPLVLETIELSSYGNDQESSGKIIVRKEVPRFPEGSHLLIVEDILDTGLTIAWLREKLLTSGVASVEVVVMLHKTGKQKNNYLPRFIGFPVEDWFVYGYGMDIAEQVRNLPYIGARFPVTDIIR